ncbi:hypothetical protein VNI00_000453 [Paramarasmius palmivorus]|uniref:Uncharacterized protein n=1 Tax=Paramarasmius palmivorus TaxID=297713 RepID=A0AAW0E8Z1_9AGAR
MTNVEDWLNSGPFCWSFDENGTTQIPESMCEQLGLPTFTLSSFFPPSVSLYSFSKYTYDAVHKWQVAKKFDPATPDFARSLGFPIFERLRPEKSRFEEIFKVEEHKTLEDSPSMSDFGGSFLCRLTKSSWWLQVEAAPGIPILG